MALRPRRISFRNYEGDRNGGWGGLHRFDGLARGWRAGAVRQRVSWPDVAVVGLDAPNNCAMRRLWPGWKNGNSSECNTGRDSGCARATSATLRQWRRSGDGGTTAPSIRPTASIEDCRHLPRHWAFKTVFVFLPELLMTASGVNSFWKGRRQYRCHPICGPQKE